MSDVSLTPGARLTRIRSRHVVVGVPPSIPSSSSSSAAVDGHVVDATIVVDPDAGKIVDIIVAGSSRERKDQGFDDNVLDLVDECKLPGLIDLDEALVAPGEDLLPGSVSQTTRLAASGGVTTMLASPLVSSSPASTVDRFLANKDMITEAPLYCDVGLLGLASPYGDSGSLLLSAGARGLVFYMSPPPYPASAGAFGYFSAADDIVQYIERDADSMPPESLLCFHSESYSEQELGRASPFRMARFPRRAEQASRGLAAGNAWYMSNETADGNEVGLRHSWQRRKKKMSPAMVKATLFAERESYSFGKIESPSRRNEKKEEGWGSPLRNRRRLFKGNLVVDTMASKDNETISSGSGTDDLSAIVKTSYRVFEALRPPTHEVRGARAAIRAAETLDAARRGWKVHFLGASSSNLCSLVADYPWASAGTCPHYLYYCTDEIRSKRSDLKVSPPIRSSEKRDKLWEYVPSRVAALSAGHTPGCGVPKGSEGNFEAALCGLRSFPMQLPLTWTAARDRGLDAASFLPALAGLASSRPAQLANLAHIKGRIAEGYDADFVVFDPRAASDCFADDPDFRSKRIFGAVVATILRGRVVCSGGEFAAARGSFLQRENY